MNVLSLTYLGNVRYFSKIVSGDYVIDPWERYRKQSYRNRCVILSAMGPLHLVVPVLNPGNYSRTPVRDVRIDNSKEWQRQHWNSIRSAYSSSPYFTYYEHLLAPFYQKPQQFLAELNTGLLEVVFKIIGLRDPVSFTADYLEPLSPDIYDWREGISPKQAKNISDPGFRAVAYRQVFDDKYGFVPELSVLDLVCCCGPQSMEVLQQSIVPSE